MKSYYNIKSFKNITHITDNLNSFVSKQVQNQTPLIVKSPF